MSYIPIPPYEPSFKPVPQVTPFTYRDGVTMLKKLEGLVKYLNKVIIPFINENNKELADKVEADINNMINVVNTAISNLESETDTKLSDMQQIVANAITYVDEQVQLIIEDSIQVQDPVVAGIFNNAQSETRQAMDAIYGSKSVVDATANTVDNGRLSATEMGNTWESQTRAKNRSIILSDFGTLIGGDVSNTLNAAFAAASGRTLVFNPGVTVSTTENTLSNAHDTIIDGNGATINLVGTATRIGGIKLSGTIQNAIIQNLTINGSGVILDAHAGIYCASGQTIKNVTIRNNNIKNVTIGISMSADGGGSIDGLRYENNVIENALGIDSGYGYGLHLSASGTVPNNVKVVGNTVKSAQRHSIYIGKGTSVLIANNEILNHRDQNKTNAVRSAIMVARSSDVQIVNNQVYNPAGGAIYIGGKVDGDHSENYVVKGNILRNSQDAVNLVYIGQQGPTVEGYPLGVIFEGNTLWTDTPKSLMTVWSGKVVQITNNLFIGRGVGGMNGIIFNGLETTTNEYLDNISVEGNYFDLDASSTASKIAMRISPSNGTQTVRYRFARNVLSAAFTMFAASETITNPNITVENQLATGLSGIVPTIMPINTPFTPTPPTNGAGAPLPGNPLAYIRVNIAGNMRRIPFWSDVDA